MSTTTLTENDPRIACVIPAYNREMTLTRAIESALEQTVPPSEIIVVDDGSKDGTAACIRANGDRVKYVWQENTGASAARNHGVRIAQADWIAFLDSDDYWCSRHLEAISDAIRETSGRAVYYFGDLERPRGSGRVRQFELAHFQLRSPYHLFEDGTPWLFGPRLPMHIVASVFAREAFLEHGGFWEELTSREDTHLLMSLGVGRPVCAVDELGAVMTDDDATNRLTVVEGGQTLRYWRLSILLWRDLLRRFPQLDDHPTRLLQQRCALAHIRASRFELRSAHLFAMMSDLAVALRLDPGTVWRTFRRAARLGGRFTDEERPAD